MNNYKAHRVDFAGSTFFVSADAFELASMALDDAERGKGRSPATALDAARALRDIGMTLVQARVSVEAVLVSRGKDGAG